MTFAHLLRAVVAHAIAVRPDEDWSVYADGTVHFSHGVRLSLDGDFVVVSRNEQEVARYAGAVGMALDHANELIDAAIKAGLS